MFTLQMNSWGGDPIHNAVSQTKATQATTAVYLVWGGLKATTVESMAVKTSVLYVLVS